MIDILARYANGERTFSGADLMGASLRGANLVGVDLRRAYLGRANLEGANLVGLNLEAAYLGMANLEGANLKGANLGRADLRGTDLLAGLVDHAALRRQVHDQIRDHPELHDQSEWHTETPCGTAHCVAGWTVTFAGPLGRFMERQYGTATAADLLLGGKVRPSFDPDTPCEDILRDLMSEVVA